MMYVQDNAAVRPGRLPKDAHAQPTCQVARTRAKSLGCIDEVGSNPALNVTAIRSVIGELARSCDQKQ